MIGKHGAICDCELVDRGDVNKRISPDFLWNTFFKSFGKLFLNIIQWLKLISFSNVCAVLQVNIFNNILVCCLIVGSVSFPFLVTPGFPDGTVVKNLPAKAGDKREGFNPWVRKITWRRKWQPLQYSCLENPMNRGAWRATVHGVTKSQTRLSDWERSAWHNP